MDPNEIESDDQHLIERTESSREVYRGSLLHVKADAVRLPDGRPAQREYIVHPGAVAIVPRLPDGRILLERQFRYPLQRVFIEIPAGKLDPEESPLACAERELMEETGYRARRWEYLATMHSVVAYSTEHIDLYYADDLEFVAQKLDDGEFIETIVATPEEVYAWLAAGTITDAKTMLGLLLARARLLSPL